MTGYFHHHVLPQIDVTDHSHHPVISDVNNCSINRDSPTPNRLSVPGFYHSFLPCDTSTPVEPSSSSSSTSCSTLSSHFPFPSSSSISSAASSPFSFPALPKPPLPDEEWWWGFSSERKYDFVAKIILLGDYGVGKSTLLNTLGGVRELSWCRCRTFRAKEYVELECLRDDKKVLIRVMDTGGQERYRSLTSSYFRGVHGCLLTFSVNNEESFNNVINWFQDLNSYASPHTHIHTIPSLVVGVVPSSSFVIPIPVSSSSLSSPSPSFLPAHRQIRQVPAERAFRLAESLSLTYCETHVRDEEMILFILRRLVNNVLVNSQRRPSLAITIMPAFQKGDEKKKKWKQCCRSS